MGIAACKNCGTLISLSLLEGGNPVAIEEHWATEYARCERCGSFLCGLCVKNAANNCPFCGIPVTITDYREEINRRVGDIGGWQQLLHGIHVTIPNYREVLGEIGGSGRLDRKPPNESQVTPARASDQCPRQNEYQNTPAAQSEQHDAEWEIGQRTISDTLCRLALHYRREQQFEISEHFYLRALRVLEGQPTPDLDRIARVMEHLAHLFSSQCEYGKAECYNEKAIEVTKRTRGFKIPRLFRMYANLLARRMMRKTFHR